MRINAFSFDDFDCRGVFHYLKTNIYSIFRTISFAEASAASHSTCATSDKRNTRKTQHNTKRNETKRNKTKCKKFQLKYSDEQTICFSLQSFQYNDSFHEQN